MNLLKQNVLAWVMLSMMSLPGVVMAEVKDEVRVEDKAVLQSTPATQSAPVLMDELMQPGQKCNKRDGSGYGATQGEMRGAMQGTSQGMAQGMRGKGMGMMSSPEAIEKCHRGEKAYKCDKGGKYESKCENKYENDSKCANKMAGEGKRGHCDRKGQGASCDCPVAERVDALEKRIDMMQMMMQMMMQR